jgi:hypothetical protein
MLEKFPLFNEKFNNWYKYGVKIPHMYIKYCNVGGTNYERVNFHRVTVNERGLYHEGLCA